MTSCNQTLNITHSNGEADSMSVRDIYTTTLPPIQPKAAQIGFNFFIYFLACQ